MSQTKYNPIPSRVWNRVQGRCSTDSYDPNINYSETDYEKQMLFKGNILQYKKNSSNLTKKQKYTQIAKGMWTNRNKTWATQSATYTNPNTSSLLRVNWDILDPLNNNFSKRSNSFGCSTSVIQNGGNLVCNTTVNPCTQEIIKKTKSQQLCNPTTDSDVPGQIQDLCWNDGTQTWYPRQRYIMPTTTDKWPTGYKGFVSAFIFDGPVLSADQNISISWTYTDSVCLPITSFNIYKNSILLENVPVSQTSFIINQSESGTFIMYVTSLSNITESNKSNIVSITI